MNNNPWHHLPRETPDAVYWLNHVLMRNKHCSYLSAYGSPTSIEEYRTQLPLVSYEDLRPWIDRVKQGKPDILFDGRPVAYERTGGSSGGSKLIPYTTECLLDFQNNILPWLYATIAGYGINQLAYFSISPILRNPESINGINVGLPDGAYLGAQAAAIVSKMSAVPVDVANISNLQQWREKTLAYLKDSSHMLEIISVWSPTFFLDLMKDQDTRQLFPNLKVISCWASATAAPYAEELHNLFPQAHLQAKGLLSTECVVTTPDRNGNPVLARHGFFEFKLNDQLFLEKELVPGNIYEVIATTAAGLYRYRTGDLVSYAGPNDDGRPILHFIGRGSLVSDLVGEKLAEPFVAECLRHIKGFRLLIPDSQKRCYQLVIDHCPTSDALNIMEHNLRKNPQYAYARDIGQLKNMEIMFVKDANARYIELMLGQGIRLGDIKPVALRNEPDWIKTFGDRKL